MINLTQAEFGIACMMAGILLLMIRHWRIVVAIYLFFWFIGKAQRWKDYD